MKSWAWGFMEIRDDSEELDCYAGTPQMIRGKGGTYGL
jgi:hypothetical protein